MANFTVKFRIDSVTNFVESEMYGVHIQVIDASPNGFNKKESRPVLGVIDLYFDNEESSKAINKGLFELTFKEIKE
jgi:hypothetical protein